jgi:putative flippase GtrA
MRHHIVPLVRFCVVGALCYFVSMCLFAALCELAQIHYMPAFVITFLVVNVFGYLLNSRFTYGTRAGPDRAALVRYLMVNVAILLVNLVAIRVLVEDAHIWYLAATMIVAAINAPVGFIAHKIVTYRVGHASTADARPPAR